MIALPYDYCLIAWFVLAATCTRNAIPTAQRLKEYNVEDFNGRRRDDCGEPVR
jgi:hypothetical protein